MYTLLIFDGIYSIIRHELEQAFENKNGTEVTQMEKSLTRLEAIFKVWKILGDVDVEITSESTFLKGRFIKYANRMIHLSGRRQFGINPANIHKIKFTQIQASKIEIEILMEDGYILIKPVL